MTINNKNILLADFQMQFIYKFDDKFENTIYVFKVIQQDVLKKINKEINKMKKDDILTGFTYTKDDELYIKVKSQHIKKLNKIKFEKEENYKTHLNLVYYDFKDKKGYYATMYDTELIKNDVFESD